MSIGFPISVRYVKNGRGGQWWPIARTNGQLHLGWKRIPHDFLLSRDFVSIEQELKKQYGDRAGAKQDFNQLREVIEDASQHLWITFEEGCLWWCTLNNDITVNPDGESSQKGNFWLACDRNWSNRSLNGKLLAISDLPGTVTTTAGFKGTVCTPRAWQTVLRIIKDEKDLDTIHAEKTRAAYIDAVSTLVKRLSPQDFEQLVDLILTRTGWTRISTLGKTREGIDVEAENLTAGEIAFVQVKSTANQKILNDYITRFNARRDLYARMIFAVHTPIGKLSSPGGIPLHIWTIDIVGGLVVRLGLGEWVENRIA